MPKLKGIDISKLKSDSEKMSSKTTSFPSISKSNLEQVYSLDALSGAYSKSSFDLLNINPFLNFLSSYKDIINPFSSLQKTLGLSSCLEEQYKPPSYFQDIPNLSNWQRALRDMNKSYAEWSEYCFARSFSDSFQSVFDNLDMKNTLFSKSLDMSQSYQSYLDSILSDTGNMFSSALYPTSNALKMLSFEGSKLSDLMRSFSELDFEKEFPHHAHDDIFPTNEPKKSDNTRTEISDTQLKELQKDISEIADSFDVGGLKGQQKIEAIISKWETQNPIVARFIPYLFSLILFVLGLWLSSSTHTTTINIIVRENPQNKSKPIERLEKRTHVQVVESVKYYYKINYLCEKTHTQRQGWVAKRNLTKLDT